MAGGYWVRRRRKRKLYRPRKLATYVSAFLASLLIVGGSIGLLYLTFTILHGLSPPVE